MSSGIYDFRSDPDCESSFTCDPDSSTDVKTPLSDGDGNRYPEDLLYPPEFPDRREYPEDYGFSPDFPYALGMFSIVPAPDLKLPGGQS